MHTDYLRNHLFSILFVALVFAVIYYQIDETPPPEIQDTELDAIARLKSINFDKSLDRAVFEDIYGIYYPEQIHGADSLITRIKEYRRQQEIRSSDQSPFTITTWDLPPMILQFILVYISVLFLTYYAVQIFGLYRFIREKQGRESYIFLFYQRWCKNDFNKRGQKLRDLVFLAAKALIKGIIYFILFSPAYVIAYSFKTRFDTNSLIFMIGLGTISNAFLITYIQKFYTFLVAESRKGYVETAVVKNLTHSFTEIHLKNIFRIRPSFPNHILDQIYENARYQYFSSIKEQASFLITGLIIIEMALNIQNHLCYTLLQTILYEEYFMTLLIVFVIFLLVKLTEITIDSRLYRRSKLYNNQST